MSKFKSGTLRNVFRAFHHFRIIVIGDVMIDSYMWGDVKRISPEAPIPILASNRRENRLGGAANVALNIQSFGSAPILCSVIGEDDQGKLFTERMRNARLEPIGLLTDSGRITTRKTRIISRNQQLIRIDEENDSPLSPALEARFMRHIERLVSAMRIDAIVMEDYDKGVLTPAVIKHTIDLANRFAIPVFADPKHRNFLQYRNITMLKPNFRELNDGLKTELNRENTEALFEACSKYQEDAGIQFLMVSLSEHGVFVSDGQQYLVIPAQVRDVADVSGAGDTLISTATVCYIAGLDLEDIASIANIAGGLVCEKAGVVPVSGEELLRECELLLEK